jgi:hypothetical protein
MQVNGPAAALVAATDYTLLVLGGIVVSVFLTSLLLSVIFCRSSLSKKVKIILEGKVTCLSHRDIKKSVLGKASPSARGEDDCRPSSCFDYTPLLTFNEDDMSPPSKILSLYTERGNGSATSVNWNPSCHPVKK